MTVTTTTPLAIRCFEAGDTDVVVALWQEAFPEYRDVTRPQRNPHLSIANKMTTQPELFFVATCDARVVGTLMAGFDGHRGWLYSFGVSNDARRLGIGRALIAHAESALAARGCLKINLQVLPGNDDACRFYAALGYRVEERISFGKTLPAA